MQTIDNIKNIDILINNYRNFLGQKTIICDIPLNSLKSIAKILPYYKSEVLFLRRKEKDIENLASIKKHLNRIENGECFAGYKRASKYINTVKEVVLYLEKE